MRLPQPTPDSALPLIPQVPHPLYQGSAEVEWQFHRTVVLLGAMTVGSAAVSLLALDPTGTPMLCGFALATIVLGRVVGRSTERLWSGTPNDRLPTMGEALLALLTSLPALWSVYVGLAGAVLNALHTGDMTPVVIALAVAWGQYTGAVITGYRAWRQSARNVGQT